MSRWAACARGTRITSEAPALWRRMRNEGRGRVRPWLQPHAGIQRRPHWRVPKHLTAAFREVLKQPSSTLEKNYGDEERFPCGAGENPTDNKAERCHPSQR